MAAASLPSGLHTPPLADLVRLFSSATLTGYVRRQEAPSFAREAAGCLPFWFDMSRRDHPDAGGVLTPLLGKMRLHPCPLSSPPPRRRALSPARSQVAAVRPLVLAGAPPTRDGAPLRPGLD